VATILTQGNPCVGTPLTPVDFFTQDTSMGMVFAIRKAHKVSATPAFVHSTTDSYFFNSERILGNFYIFPKINRQNINELELLTSVSKKLPEWIYFYVPPKKVYQYLPKNKRRKTPSF